MTVQEYINSFNDEHEHIYSESVLLRWINTVEQNVYADNIKEYLNKYYDRVLNEFQYSLPTGVDFTDVKKVYVNGIPYKKKDVRAYKESRIYWYEDGKLCIYPACSQTDTSYTSDEGEITFAANSITTTGDDFSGISIGDVIMVSDATTDANCRYATVLGVSEKVLTFASGTFTAGTDVAAVTISVPKIKITYQYKPVEKLIANIETDELIIPNRFHDVYEFYMLQKIAYNAKDWNEAANHMQMYNAAVANYVQYWENSRPMNPLDDIQVTEEWENSNSASFDEE